MGNSKTRILVADGEPCRLGLLIGALSDEGKKPALRNVAMVGRQVLGRQRSKSCVWHLEVSGIFYYTYIIAQIHSLPLYGETHAYSHDC
jgi:hypothetical protein